jgi:hypothetical protein
MARSKTGSNSIARTRTDGRRPLLVYLDQEIIKLLKKVALDQERPAYEITEEAVRGWLATHKLIPKRKVD